MRVKKLSRRKFIAGGVLFFSASTLSGCLPFFGIMLRGGAMRAFAVGARVGGATSLVSLGRGVGIAGRGARSARVAIGPEPVRIVSADGQILARSMQQQQSTVLMRGNQPIFRSTPNARNQSDVGRLDHVDLHGNNVGRSVFEHSGRVDHYGRNSEQRVGFDVVVRGARLIRHFDQDENEIGETELQENGQYTDVVADDATDTYLAELEERDERCPAMVLQRDVYHNTVAECTVQGGAACQRQNIEFRRLQVLEQACNNL